MGMLFSHAAVILLALGGFANAAEPAAATVPHIALLLPLNSPTLGAAAATVLQGISAAGSIQAFPLQIYSDFDEAGSVLIAYKKAIANGAVGVIGPLTRSGISQLAREPSIAVPTLALNIIEGSANSQLYFFGLAVEREAKQIANLAKKQGMKQAIVISANEPLARRLQFAFEEQWISSGGKVLREIDFSGDTAALADIPASADNMVFIATDAEQTRTLRPYLPVNLPVYATSQLYTGNKDTLLNFDLNGIRFVDMPWLMQTDAPYPRASPPLTTNMERLYALGIDAWRLINMLIRDHRTTAEPMNGVTGKITLVGQTFEREALPSLFVQGRAQAADAPVVPGVQMFPDQFKSAVETAPAGL